MFDLEIETDGTRKRVSLQGRTSWVIGRGRDCDVRVADPYISSRNARIEWEAGHVRLRRLRGSNPVYLGGAPVEETLLEGNACFRIGRTTFRVVFPDRVAMNDPFDTASTAILLDATTILFGDETSALPPSDEVDPETSTNSSPLPPRSAHPGPEEKASEALRQVSVLLKGVQSEIGLADAVLKLACERMGAERSLLARVMDDEGLEVIAVHGMQEHIRFEDLVSKSVLKKVVRESQAVLIGEAGSWGETAGAGTSLERKSIHAVACVPILDDAARVEAVLYVDHQSRLIRFHTGDGAFLVWLGQVYRLLLGSFRIRRRLETEIITLKNEAARSAGMIVASESMIRLLEKAGRAAASEASILILGETGVGKECLARFIHDNSSRKKGPYVARNCAALPESLFESEMFGHKKGAFTGATHDRAGAFREAHGGTLFLDEIGDLALNSQTKLLRALQDKSVQPVGEDKLVAADARVICATNQDLAKAISQKTFREDLFYRVATVRLEIPPLRERKEDIRALARHFIQSLSGGTRKLSRDAEEALLEYAWPGNIRELRACLEQAAIFSAANQITAEELNLPRRNQVIELDGVKLETLSMLECRHIMKVLRAVSGNRTRAAKVLGIARSTLFLKLKACKQEFPNEFKECDN